MPPSNAQQYLIELINRARLDPLTEVALTNGLATIDGNAPAGSYSTAPVQALAWNAQLGAAAQGHNDWMAANETISHTGDGGSQPWERAFAAGYSWNGFGENLAMTWGSAPLTVEGTIAVLHEALFRSDGHRANLLQSAYQEVGVGTGVGFFTDGGVQYHAAYLTETFGRSNPETFLTGVVFNDTDSDGFYTYGEGVGGATFAIGATTVTSQAAGGYNLQLAPTANAALTVTVSGQTAQFIVDLSGGNVKFDVINPAGTATALVAGDTTLVNGFITDMTVLGAVDADLTGDGRANILTGSRGANALNGMAGLDTIIAGDGNDTVDGGAGNDRLLGGAGNDELRGGSFHDTIIAGSGDDTVWGDNGRDVVYLGAGRDLFHDNAQDDQFGHDYISGWTGRDTINGGGGRDTIYGGAHQDVLRGGTNNDQIHGGSYSDTIYGGDGNDTVWGDNGADRVYLGNGDDVFHDNAQTGSFGRDVVLGGYGNDTLNGAGGNDSLRGQWGSDVIGGGAGADTLSGGIGDDTLSGGTGVDVFYVNATLSPGADRITDFEDGTDILRFDNALFADLTITAQGPGGADALINWASGSLVLENTAAHLVTSADFDFI